MRLISFAVENHKNFREQQGMFFTPEEGEGAYTSVGVYGPNSGGKTNFLTACHSVALGLQGHEMQYTPNNHATGQGSSYEWTVAHDDKVYVYAYSIDNSGITNESLEYMSASDYDNEGKDDPDTVKSFEREDLGNCTLLAYELLRDEILDGEDLAVLKYLSNIFWASPENTYVSPKLVEDRGLTCDEVIGTFVGAVDGMDKPFNKVTSDDLNHLSPTLQDWVETTLGIVSALYDGRFVIADNFGEGVHPELVYDFLEGINGGLYLRDSEPVKQMVYATQNVAVMYSLTHLVGLTQAHNVCFIDRNHNGKTEIFDIQDFKEEETRTHRMFGMYIRGKLGATPVGMSFPYRVQ
jgi:hypothetical protein